MEHILESDTISTTDVKLDKSLFEDKDEHLKKCNLCGTEFNLNDNFSVVFQNKHYFYVCWNCVFSRVHKDISFGDV